MNQLLVASSTLDPHVALSCRIIRADPLLRSYLRWFAQPSSVANVPLMPASRLLESVNSLTEVALLKSSQPPSQRRIGYGLWFSSAIAFAAGRNSESGIPQGITLNLLATCLLPLYRAQFVDNYLDSLDHTRNRLKELLILTEIIGQLQLTELLEHETNTLTPPQTILLKSLQIDLAQINHCLDCLLPQFDEQRNEFDFVVPSDVASFSAEDLELTDKSPNDWDSAESFWQIASELNSPSPGITLPRSWLQPSIDWQQVTEHWMQLMISLDAPGNRGQHGKYVIGEIVDLQDTIFFDSLRNQIAFCRRERRPMSLALIELMIGDLPSENGSTGENQNGQRQWKKNLIQWLAEHAEEQNSIFFVTSSQQLVVSTTDCERHEMTSLIRSGLNELQSRFKQLPNERSSSSAGYHVGIASTPNPSINLDAGDIVESARRCLEASRKMGMETIKSIEVF